MNVILAGRLGEGGAQVIVWEHLCQTAHFG